jgi:alanyl-tRNA synthetase
MTDKVYEKNSYLTELDTVVTECIKEEDHIYLKLRETIFFPEEGGQYSDTGVIIAGDRKMRVLKGELIGNASECETDIRYLVDADETVEPGMEVKCVLDWEQRFSRMQNHSGEHIVSGLIHNIHRYNNIGFHLSDDEPVTLTVDGKLNAEQIREIELKANEAIYANLPITDTYPTKEEAARAVYRSKIEIAGQVRLITIGDMADPLDVCACCAPHVERTGAIGIIKVIASAGIREGTQLQILCGRRALEFIEKNIDALESIARSFSTHRDNVPGLVEDLKNENRELKNRLSLLAETTIIETAKADISEGKCCIFTDIEISPLSMKNIFNELLKMKKGYVGIFVGNEEDGYRYNAGGDGLDARVLATKMREELSAKGGGSPEMIQGKVNASRKAIEELFASLN